MLYLVTGMSNSRKVYVVVCLVIAIGLGQSYDSLISTEWIDKFAVWCGGATLVALAVAVGEIFHAGRTNKKIADSIASTTMDLVTHSSAAHLIESISLLDDTSNSVLRGEYLEALRSLQVARRFWVKVSRRVLTLKQTDDVSALFTKAEKKVSAGAFSTLAAPLSPQQVLEISATIVKIKNIIERIERSGEKNHAAT